MTESPLQRPSMRHRLELQSRNWWDAGLARQLSRRAVRRARIHLIVLAPVVAGILLVYAFRGELFGPGWDTPVRAGTALALLILGWHVARDVGRSLRPVLFRHMEPATAGTVGFLIRLVTMLATAVLALRIAKLDPRTLALGGALTAVLVGLAAQQTIGNLIAGTILVSARPFQVGDRVRMQGGGLAGSIEGVVSSVGLLYTILASGEDAIMVPNSVVMSVAVVPLREPTGVELRARLRPGATPLDVQERLQEALTVPLRGSPRVTLEELDGDEVVVRIGATPLHPPDGSQLAGEVLRAIAPLTAHTPASL